MKLLVVGSGGREHAIAKKLLASKDVDQVFVAPGNDGMTLDGLDLVNIGISEHSRLIDFAKENEIAWTFIGPDGPKVIEFNSRFGDPETQIILPRLTSDFAQNIDDIMMGIEPYITWQKDGVTLGVVVASEGYPLDYEKGVPLPEKTDGDIITYYAGAKFAENSKALLSNGGRVYMLVTTEGSVKAGQDKIYTQLAQQDTTGLFYRNDIGSKAIK
ncbi:TPA: phosphoribosylglycinamide synthetase C domain-containing protein [Streptococcus agalactiae]